jgi:hypothetical protein
MILKIQSEFAVHPVGSGGDRDSQLVRQEFLKKYKCLKYFVPKPATMLVCVQATKSSASQGIRPDYVSMLPVFAPFKACHTAFGGGPARWAFEFPPFCGHHDWTSLAASHGGCLYKVQRFCRKMVSSFGTPSASGCKIPDLPTSLSVYRPREFAPSFFQDE